LHRCRERLACAGAAGNDVAVSASRERICLPVVLVSALEHRAHPHLLAEHRLQAVERSAGQLGFATSGKALRIRAAGPGVDQRAAQRDSRPERAEGLTGRAEERGVAIAAVVDLFPERLAEM